MGTAEKAYPKEPEWLAAVKSEVQVKEQGFHKTQIIHRPARQFGESQGVRPGLRDLGANAAPPSHSRGPGDTSNWEKSSPNGKVPHAVRVPEGAAQDGIEYQTTTM